MPERVYLDRIEGDRAILLCGADGREQASIPAQLLPAGVKEGMALDFTLAPAPDDSTGREVKDLMEDLFEETGS